MSPMDPRDHASHDLDSLSGALDGSLREDRLAAALDLVRSCPECRAAYEAMAWARQQAGRLPATAPPPDLEEEIRRRLDREAMRAPRSLGARRAAGLTLAALLVLALAGVLAWRLSRPASLPAAVAAQHRALADGRLSLALETADPARLEAWLDSASLGFPTRVFDLGMMGYELRGGRTHVVAGRPTAVIVYRESATGREVICLMMVGGLADLPSPDARREHDGIPFHVYRVDELTLVFWPEGDVLCVLAGAGDPEALVQLAFAKAMKQGRRQAEGSEHRIVDGNGHFE